MSRFESLNYHTVVSSLNTEQRKQKKERKEGRKEGNQIRANFSCKHISILPSVGQMTLQQANAKRLRDAIMRMTLTIARHQN